MRQRTYAILGAGALGGYYGALLQKAGFETHFLARSDYDRIRQQGWIVESPNGDFLLPRVSVFSRAADIPPCDVALICLKTTQNTVLGDIVPPALRANGVAITLQNGLGNEEALAEIVGPERVMGGLCFLCSNKAGPGHIRHLDYGQITLGEYAPGSNGRGITPRLRDIGDDLQRAGIPVELTGDLRLARWQKLLWNVPFNGLSVVLDATTDQLMADPATRRLAEALMREIRGGAQACGVEIQEKTIQEMLRRTEKMTPYRTSMKIDFDERRPMEIEAIFGAPLRAAREAGFDAPRLDALCAMLRFLDARNRSVNG